MAQTPQGALKLAAAAAGLTMHEYCTRRAAGLKRCGGCHEWKPIAEFNRDSSRSDGFASKARCCSRVKIRVDRRGRPSAFRGKRHTERAKLAMSQAAKGRPSHRLGKKHTPETIAKISAVTKERTPRGASHYAYSHGKRQRNLDLRRRPEYVAWRAAVFQRDGYRCRDCGDDCGGNLRAHHEKPLAERPDLAYDVDNGVTLCHPCHELRHFKPDSIRNERKRKRGERLWR